MEQRLSRACACLAALALLLSVTSTGAAETANHETDPAQFVMHYYENPEPERIGWALDQLSERKIWERPGAAAGMMAFLSLVFRANPDRIPAWADHIEGKPSDERYGLYLALWMSADPAATEILERAKEHEEPGLSEPIEHYLSLEPPAVDGYQIDGPEKLDLNWGAFFATGDARYVRRVLGVLTSLDALGADARDSEHWAAIQSAARWSVTSNARQHPLVRQICEELLLSAEPPMRRELREILQNADRSADAS